MIKSKIATTNITGVHSVNWLVFSLSIPFDITSFACRSFAYRAIYIHFSSQSHFVGTKIDTRTHAPTHTHTYVYILKSWSTLIAVLWVCVLCVHIAEICNWAGFLSPIRTHFAHNTTCTSACSCLWYPKWWILFCRRDDKEKHQKAIAIAHEMARQEFIFNQLILIHFYRWIFCILSDEVLFSPASNPRKKNEKPNARSCMHAWCTNAVRKYWLNRIFEMFLLIYFHMGERGGSEWYGEEEIKE